MLLTILRGFEKIRRTSSRTKKTEIMEYLLKEKPMTRTILKYTYDPFMMYNMTSSVEFENPPVKSYQHAHPDDAKWKAMRIILDELRARTITGNKARKRVDLFLGNVNREISEVYAYWFMRILHKDLKIGLGITTIDKLVPGLIPTFKIQKAKVYEDGDVLPMHFAIEPKYDGLRGLVVIDNDGHASAFSSKGKPLFNLDHILRELEALDIGGVVLDGEFFGSDWNNSISVMQTESRVKSKVKYYVFDMLRLEEWVKKKCKLDNEARVARADKLLKFHKLAHVKRVPRVEATSRKSLDRAYAKLLEEGYEGAMVKAMDGKYEFKRSTAWMKYKPEHSCDLKIVGVQEGEGKLRGMLGALLCMGKAEWKGKVYAVKTKVGTGFKEPERRRLWKLAKKKKLLGLIAEVKFQEIALNKTKVKIHALRFPVYVRLRIDK